MAANRGDSFIGALTRIWGRGGILGCKNTFLGDISYKRDTDRTKIGQSTRGLFLGLGLKRPRKVPSYSSLPPKPNIMLALLALAISLLASQVVLLVVLPKHMQRWDFVLV